MKQPGFDCITVILSIFFNSIIVIGINISDSIIVWLLYVTMETLTVRTTHLTEFIMDIAYNSNLTWYR